MSNGERPSRADNQVFHASTTPEFKARVDAYHERFSKHMAEKGIFVTYSDTLRRLLSAGMEAEAIREAAEEAEAEAQAAKVR